MSYTLKYIDRGNGYVLQEFERRDGFVPFIPRKEDVIHLPRTGEYAWLVDEVQYNPVEQHFYIMLDKITNRYIASR